MANMSLNKNPMPTQDAAIRAKNFSEVALGYSEINAGNQLFSVALNMRYLVAALYLFAAIMQCVGLALVYNLDKKTLAKMNAELEGKELAPFGKWCRMFAKGSIL